MEINITYWYTLQTIVNQFFVVGTNYTPPGANMYINNEIKY